MEDWKVRQELYHRLNSTFSDDLNQFQIEFTDDVIGDAVRYFKETDLGWIYPSKSYMVGICYSKWLSEDFGGDPIKYLSDASLLHGNDPYFVPYFENTRVYISILELIGGWGFDQSLGMIPDVRKYYEDEFMIDSLPSDLLQTPK